MKKEKLDLGVVKLQKAKENWNLIDDGDSFSTEYSLLQPVRYEDKPAMLKISLQKEKHATVPLLLCWNGKNAVKVFKYSEDALLMERVEAKRSLKNMVITGLEDEANDIICQVVNRLHQSGCQHIPELISLTTWFRSLSAAAENYRGLFDLCHKITLELLAYPREIVALHGDVHYDNIIDSNSRKWIAIDPKGLVGERGFDFANIFCNPDLSIAGAPGRLS